MTQYARIYNGAVAELFSTDGDITQMFTPDIVWIPLPDNSTVSVGWLYSNGSFSQTPYPQQSDYDSMWLLIQGERDRRKTTGGYKVGNYWFHSDDTSRIQQLALTMMGANMPSGIMWKTMSGDFVLMTPTLAGQIFQAAAASDISIFSVAEAKKAEMLATSTPATYNYLSGWPLMYGE